MSTITNLTPSATLPVLEVVLSPPYRTTEEGEVRITEEGEPLALE